MISSSFRQLVRLFLKLLMIAAIVLICDQGIGRVLKFFYFRSRTGFDAQITYCIDSTRADILIFGSSRATHSYVPEVFEEKLPVTCYNVGRDGSFILYNYALFKAITSRYSPKLIIFDIRPEDISYSATEYERLSLLLPYYQTHPEIRSTVDLGGPLIKIKHMPLISHYNSLILQIAKGNLGNRKVKLSDHKGYVPIIKKMKHENINALEFKGTPIDENKILALKDIITTCQKRKIELVFVFSPIWSIIQDSVYNPVISELCLENNIKYIEMSDNPEFISNPGYFSDISHLNDEGAKEFSNILINKIWPRH